MKKRAKSPARRKVKARSKSDSTANNFDRFFIDWLDENGHKTKAGNRVTPNKSLGLPAVWSCVRVKSEDTGKLPCIMYRRLPGGGKERATDHPYYSLIRDNPNPRMTAFDFKRFMQMQLDLRGNALALKDVDGRGRVTALWPVPWTRVEVLCTPDEQELFYAITDRHGHKAPPVPAEAVVHLRGASLDGMIGISPIAYHRETIGLAMAAAEYGAAFFGNSAQPKGGLKVPTVLSAPASKLLRDDWEDKHKGVENSHRLAIFDGGLEWVQTGMDNSDAQYIETRKLQNTEIWRIYRMPPHKVADLDKATFSNIEQQSLEYVTDCLMPDLVGWEQTLARDLLLEEERKEYFFEFLVDALLRADFKTRMEGYAIARNWGLMSADEVRDKENMNPVPDGKGKMFLQPLNMTELGSKPPPGKATGPDLSADGAKELIKHLQIFVSRAEAGAHNGAHHDA